MDSWVVQNQLAWTALSWGSTAFSLYESFIYETEEEVQAWDDYLIHNYAAQGATLRVHDLFESDASDPLVAANMCQADMELAIDVKATSRIVFGELIREQNSIGVVGIAFSWSPEGEQRQNRFIVLRVLQNDLTEYLRGYSESRAIWLAGQGGCYPLPNPCVAVPPPGPPECQDATSV